MVQMTGIAFLAELIWMFSLSFCVLTVSLTHKASSPVSIQETFTTGT
jgi:hypothetical protein